VGGEHEPRGRKNADGSIDVWVRGRRLTFPGGGRKPTVSDEAPPPDADDLPSGVLIDVGNAVTMVSHDGWYARVGGEEVGINRTKARRPSGRLYGP
jgi:hypothetical protein